MLLIACLDGDMFLEDVALIVDRLGWLEVNIHAGLMGSVSEVHAIVDDGIRLTRRAVLLI